MAAPRGRPTDRVQLGFRAETAATPSRGSVSHDRPAPAPASQPLPPSPEGPPFDVVEEVRLAVVMYGGVSLSIYMNGVAQEMFHLVRATAASHPSGPAALPDAELTGSQRVYRSVAQLDPEGAGTSVPDPADAIRRRFVIDVLSGTSAGGINAVFLAKALANDQPMAGLTALWLDEGDIAKLLNDAGSVTEGMTPERPPASLLNSGRMYVRLLDAFDSMDRAKEWSADRPSTLADAVDLFVTTTDLYGFEMPLRLSNTVATERRYRNVYRFSYSAGELRPGADDEDAANPFHRGNNPFLAFACRCTSAFPLAFKPMTLRDVDGLVSAFPRYAGLTSSTEAWRAFYPDYAAVSGTGGPEFRDRPFADGGALDNKPFGYAVDILRTRRAQVPVDRKLVFVEPDPSPPSAAEDRLVRPDALRNFLEQGVLLPRQETIRDDLNRVDDLNRMARRVDTALRAVVEGLEVPWATTATVRIERTPADALDVARAATAADSVGRRGYLALRDEAVVEDLAALVARAGGVPTGREYFAAIRALLKAWRDLRYGGDDGTISLARFLWTFDQQYRLRRLAFLERRTDSIFRGDQAGRRLLERFGAAEEAGTAALRPPLTLVKQGITRATAALLEAERDLRTGAQGHELRDSIAASGIGLEALGRILDATSDDARRAAAEEIVAAGLDAVDRVMLGISVARTEAASLAFDAVAGGLDGAASPEYGTAGRTAAAVAAWAYTRFDEFDMVAFPLQYGTDAGEGDQVEVVRISPGDATGLIARDAAAGAEEHGEGAGKVTGGRVNHFGAFLDRLWRENDIMWGRLDAAEILVDTLVPRQDGEEAERRRDAVVAGLRNRAFCAILHEELQREDIAGLFQAASEAEREGIAVPNRVKDLVDAADGCTDDIVEAFRDSYVRPSTLPRAEMLDTVGRAADVAGRIMGGIAHAQGEERPPLQFVLAARLGQFASALVGAAVPTSSFHRRARAGFFLAYLVGLVALVAGFAADADPVVEVAIVLLLLTGAANVGLWLVARRIRLGTPSGSLLWVSAIVAAALLAGGLVALAVAQVVRTADTQGALAWIAEGLVVAALVGGFLMLRRRPQPGSPAPSPLAGMVLLGLGVLGLVVLAVFEVIHLGRIYDWIPFVGGPGG